MERVTRQPVMVRLGGEEYPFHPKSFCAAEKWRQSLMASFPGVMKAIEGGLKGEDDLLIAAPDMLQASGKILQLFREWEPDLDWERIEADLEEEELFDGLWEVLPVAFPLFGYAANRIPDLMSRAKTRIPKYSKAGK